MSEGKNQTNSNTSDTDNNTNEKTVSDQLVQNSDNCDVITDSEDEVDEDNPKEVVEDLTYKRSLNSTTCQNLDHL